MTRPLTLPRWLAELRRRGVRVRLKGGRVRVTGARALSAEERAALVASGPLIQQLLDQRVGRRHERAERRRKRDEEQQRERRRRVVGMEVVAGYPHLSKPVYADECVPIPLGRARVLGTIGWRKSE